MIEKITIKKDKVIIWKESENNISFYFPLTHEDEKILESLPLSTKEKIVKLSLIDDIIYLSIDEKKTTLWIVAGGSRKNALKEAFKIFEIKPSNVKLIHEISQ